MDKKIQQKGTHIKFYPSFPPNLGNMERYTSSKWHEVLKVSIIKKSFFFWKGALEATK